MPSDSAIRWEFEVQWRAKKEAMERKLSESLGRPRLEKYLLWKAARKARKLKADGVIIDNKNDFRVIKFK